MAGASIIRIDSRRTHGWQARLDEGTSEYESKLFSDRKYGGNAEARAKALEFLRAKLKARGVSYSHGQRGVGPRFKYDSGATQSTNTSGVNGVFHSFHLSKNGSVLQYWAAYYTIDVDGSSCRKYKRYFYGNKRTEKEAFGLAISFRSGYEKAFRESGIDGVQRFLATWDQLKF